MPIYNGANYIENTIPYILKYDSANFELVLIDDGSKDNSLAICMKYAKRDNRIKVINKQNGGIVDARNVGVSHASGEYVAFVDQDDYIELDTIMEALCSYKADVIIFSTVKDYGYKNEPCDTVHCTKIFNSKKEIFENCIWPMVYPAANKGDVSYYGHVWQGIYKRDIINRARIVFKKYVSIEDDFIFLLEFFLNSSSVALITNVGYRWVINLQSTTYKKVYINDMQNKCEEYYSYINGILSKSEFFDEECQEKFIQMTKQVLGVRLVINEGNSSSFLNSVQILRNYRKQNDKFFIKGYLGQGASRKSANILFCLLKANAVLTALLLQKLIIYIHKIKYKIIG